MSLDKFDCTLATQFTFLMWFTQGYGNAQFRCCSAAQHTIHSSILPLLGVIIRNGIFPWPIHRAWEIVH